MTGSAKRKGDEAEREAAALIRELLGVPARRKLGAGRLDDIGDIDAVPDTVIQVVNYRDINKAVRLKLPASELQRARGGCTFAATFVRRTGGGFVVCLTPEQWATYWREALAGTEHLPFPTHLPRGA